MFVKLHQPTCMSRHHEKEVIVSPLSNVGLGTTMVLAQHLASSLMLERLCRALEDPLCGVSTWHSASVSHLAMVGEDPCSEEQP